MSIHYTQSFRRSIGGLLSQAPTDLVSLHGIFGGPWTEAVGCYLLTFSDITQSTISIAISIFFVYIALRVAWHRISREMVTQMDIVTTILRHYHKARGDIVRIKEHVSGPLHSAASNMFANVK